MRGQSTISVEVMSFQTQIPPRQGSTPSLSGEWQCIGGPPHAPNNDARLARLHRQSRHDAFIPCLRWWQQLESNGFKEEIDSQQKGC